MAIHYREVHPGQTPELRFKLLTVEPATVLRKVIEAHSIYNLKPELNNKEECLILERLLLRGSVSSNNAR